MIVDEDSLALGRRRRIMADEAAHQDAVASNESESPWSHVAAQAPRGLSSIRVPIWPLMTPWVESTSKRSIWAAMANRNSRAPRVWLGLIGLTQMTRAAGSEARFDAPASETAPSSPKKRWMNPPLYGRDSMSALFELSGEDGQRKLHTALRRLQTVNLIQSNRNGSKGYGNWGQFHLLDQHGNPYVVPHHRIDRITASSKRPHEIEIPIGFWEHSWLLQFDNKELETLLALSYEIQRDAERHQFNSDGAFLSRDERKRLGIDSKSYRASANRLVEKDVIRPVDREQYFSIRESRGRGRNKDKPHEYTINFAMFEAPPSSASIAAD